MNVYSYIHSDIMFASNSFRIFSKVHPFMFAFQRHNKVVPVSFFEEQPRDEKAVIIPRTGKGPCNICRSVYIASYNVDISTTLPNSNFCPLTGNRCLFHKFHFDSDKENLEI